MAVRQTNVDQPQQERLGDDADSIRAFGLDVMTELCQCLIDRGAKSLHFYSLNQASLILEICRRLGR